jgi:methylase of polypeptide subunit release factors
MQRADAARLETVPEAQCRRIRLVLESAGYIPLSVEEYPPFLEVRSRDGANLPRLLYLTSGGERLHTLARLFLHGVPVASDHARAALEPMSVEEWREAGLLEVEGEAVRGRLVLYPFHGLVVAMDSPELLETGAPADFVSGITNSTAALASFMIERTGGSVLDLGTGCGVLGLLAARSGARVLATDINARALSFARFNALLNGIERIEFAEGSVFDPARGRTFSLIVSNPPCIIGPAARYTFRDSGMEFDGLCRRIVREAPGYLSEGGFLQTTIEWPDFEGINWTDRLAPWFEGLGCDALALRANSRSALRHAEDTVRDTEPAGSMASEVASFAAYFENRGVSAVSDGFIMMRRRESDHSHWVELEELPPRKLEPFGAAALAFFETRDRLAKLADEDLLKSRVRMVPGLALESSREWRGEEWGAGSFVLRQSSGFRFFAETDINVANLARLCDGSCQLSELLAEMAAEMGAGYDELASGYLAVVRHMIARGFLEVESRYPDPAPR